MAYTCRHGRRGLFDDGHSLRGQLEGHQGKNDGYETLEERSSPPLDLDSNQVIEANEETLPYAEEVWHRGSQELSFAIPTRHGERSGVTKKYNPYGDDFVVDRIDLKKMVAEIVGLGEITVSEDIDIFDDHDGEWIEDRSNPEVDFDDEQKQSNEQDLTNHWVLDWLNEMTSDQKEASVGIQDVDR